MHKQKIGYARTSTFDQESGLRSQINDLEAAGCKPIYSERVSSVDKAKRVELRRALDYLREGDTLTVTKIDRLARSMRHLMEIIKEIEQKGAALKILEPDLNTCSASGKLILNIFGSVAEFEREIMLERQREGIAKAKAEGKYKGRQPTARAKSDDVLKLHNEGKGASHIARELNIGRTSVYRILDEAAQTKSK